LSAAPRAFLDPDRKIRYPSVAVECRTFTMAEKEEDHDWRQWIPRPAAVPHGKDGEPLSSNGG
jgi:hypothetical protein